MRLIGLVLLLVLLPTPTLLPAEAQLPTKMSRIGMLMPVSAEDAASNLEAFRERLGELGTHRGQEHPHGAPVYRGSNRASPRPRHRVSRLEVGPHRDLGYASRNGGEKGNE